MFTDTSLILLNWSMRALTWWLIVQDWEGVKSRMMGMLQMFIPFEESSFKLMPPGKSTSSTKILPHLLSQRESALVINKHEWHLLQYHVSVYGNGKRG